MNENQKHLVNIFLSALFPREDLLFELSSDDSELLIFDSEHSHKLWVANKENLPTYSISQTDKGEFVASHQSVDEGVWCANDGSGYPATVDMAEIPSTRDSVRSLQGICSHLGQFIYNDRLKTAVIDFNVELIHQDIK